MMNFNHPKSNISILNSYFSENLADMISCIYAYQMQGSVYIQNNVFINNSAITENHLFVGSASVLEISGLFSSIQSVSNLFYNNHAEYAAVVGIFYGIYDDFNSKYIGKLNYKSSKKIQFF